MVVDDRLNAGLRPGEQVVIARGQRMQKQANYSSAVL
jgi:hypothetical protein